MNINWRSLEGVDKFNFFRIPQRDGSQWIIYYKKFTSNTPTDKPKSFKDFIQSQPNMKQINKFKTVTIQEFQNPLEAKKPSSEDRVIQNLPESRTMLLLSVSHPFKQKEVRKWFRPFGKIRRVYIEDISKKLKRKKRRSNSLNEVNQLHFAIVVFKQEKDFFMVLKDRYEVQRRILDQFKDYRRGREFLQDQDKYYFELLSNNYQITPQELHFLKVKRSNEEQGFTLITHKDGTIAPKPKPKDMIPFPVRRKKKSAKVKPDFYKFQLSNQKLKEALGILQDDGEDVSEREILRQRKRLLKKAFRQDIEKLDTVDRKRVKLPDRPVRIEDLPKRS